MREPDTQALPGWQASFEDLGTPLAETPFVVVDLETTGGSARDSRITEIGAVRTTGGVVQGEFQTLVDPGMRIPPFIAALTGITNATLAGAPELATALPMFLDFAAGSVLVAHNAGFDISFLKAGCSALDHPWPRFPVVDTARLSRVLLHRDEVPDHKLASLARFFGAATVPNHRALSDARATVDVLHGLIERAAGFGAYHLEDLIQLGSRISPEQRRKRTLADGLPESPGVYVFRDRQGQALYVGKSRSIRKRVRSYFTAAEKRKRISEMVRIAERVEPILCATELESEVREIRMIAQHQPPYNRRSRSPERACYLRLTDEPFPRLSIVRKLPADRSADLAFIGPFSSRSTAEAARTALLAAFPLRTCTTRLKRQLSSPTCLAGDLGRCLAPCSDQSVRDEYQALVAQVTATMGGEVAELYERSQAEMSRLAAAEEFERAATNRNQLRTLLTGIQSAHQFRTLGSWELLVAARPAGPVWDLHVIRYGRLAGASRLLPKLDVPDQVEQAVAAAEQVPAPGESVTAASAEETTLILRWLFSDGVRLARSPGGLSDPIDSAGRYLAELPRPDLTAISLTAPADSGPVRTPRPRTRILT